MDITKFFDVTSFGAVGNEIADDQPAIQKAIDAAANSLGGLVWLPAGKYLLCRGLTVPSQMQIMGAGFSTPFDTGGSWLVAHREDQHEEPLISVQATGVSLRNFAIYHEHPNPESGITEYPFAVHVQQAHIHIQNLHLHNPSHGLLIRNPDPDRSAGGHQIDGLTGQPLTEGIRIGRMKLSSKFSNINFWRYWNKTSVAVANHMFENGRALIFGSNDEVVDNPMFTNFFAIGYETGIAFDGPTHKFRFANADCDMCRYGMTFQGGASYGQASNLSLRGTAYTQDGSESGIDVRIGDCELQVANGTIVHFGQYALDVNGPRSKLSFENLTIGKCRPDKNGGESIIVRHASSDVTLGVGFRHDQDEDSYVVDGDGQGSVYVPEVQRL